ncbi:NUDIX domain-containing protein [Streptomyces qinzhouensis]|uniref:NUDIX domain-containing protein n=1 Tax=Streptomyces qinzhouensis TaxID=2599401 RepID=A0A5B8JIY3_9ACTN|nr:NUDIX domain-containing protein [Streptomyces qinzhouensis]QDY79861.1 NUDIX domain-containing protein [Streptomyces qinzhouensis]
MAVIRSAGLVLYRERGGGTEVLIGHMGGPLWAHKDEQAWSFPKGQYDDGETPEAAARREFEEELGLAPPEGPWRPLGEERQPNGKLVTLWALAADLDPGLVVPGLFRMEWPPRSGRIQEFPEIDRVAWVDLPTARRLLVKGQIVFLDKLAELTAGGAGRP